MNDDFDRIQILEETMFELRRLAQKRTVSVSDIVDEALGEYLLRCANGLNLFDVIYSIESAMKRADQFVTNADPASLAIFIKSPIRYLYRPEIKYEVRIMRNDEASVGKLSVILRSHEMETLRLFSGFISLWIELEGKYLLQNRQISHVTDAGYFGRQIYYPKAVKHSDGQTIGDAISNYIRVFDELLKYYFKQRGSEQAVEKLYLERLNDKKLSI